MAWSPNTALVPRGELVSTVGEIYATIENPSLWPVVLDGIAALVEGNSAVLFANYTDSVADDILALSRSDPNIWEPYRQHYAALNVWTERCDPMFPTGTVRYSHLAIPDIELKKTEFYADFLKPNDMDYGFGVEIALPGQPAALLSAFRAGRQGPFEEQQGRILLALLPHLQRALRLHFELTTLRSAKQGLELALDAFDRAVLVSTVKGKCCSRTRQPASLPFSRMGWGSKRIASLPTGRRKTPNCNFFWSRRR